jgi:predicted DCC family thiol-disulfide oxidoreductase YuxK
MLNLLIRLDRKKIFRFAALQSEAGQRILKEEDLSGTEFNSFVLIDNGKVYLKSGAMLKLFEYLPWYLKPALIFKLIPRKIRDGAYDTVARNRYKWFGKKDSCMVPTEDVKSRFLSN